MNREIFPLSVTSPGQTRVYNSVVPSSSSSSSSLFTLLFSVYYTVPLSLLNQLTHILL